MINTVFFDLDGTLADTAPDLATALNQILEEQNRSPLPLETIRPTVSLGGNAMLRHAFGIDEDDHSFPTLRDRFLTLYRGCLADATRLFPGMDEVIDRIEADGLGWGVITNKSSWLTEPLMQELGLDHRAGCIVSGDSTPQRKPHPAPMLYACQLLGCKPSHTLYVGDAQRDIEAGQRAGMHTLVAMYGYIAEEEDPAVWGADGFVYNPFEIIAWVRNHNQAGSNNTT
ncbi:MAG: phosphoglycolate phosphatase [Gammaproteobacteria bacterium RBG_16_51_14]|nr:MAG: phosphoglycolate phosphatase [Gammaproteobacteria bacterium RBG_16_51_14]